jgi:hypothetical protein
MDNLKQYKHFLLIEFKKIIFVTLDQKNQVYLNRELVINNSEINEQFSLLEKFLNQNIFEIEKKLDDYVKDINLIMDHDDFITINLSTVHNSKNFFDQTNDISNLFINIRSSFINNMNNYEISHMLINKFIIDGKDYPLMPNRQDFENIFLEIKFICLKDKISQNLKKIFSKYQISVKKIFNFKYVHSSKKNDEKNIFITAENLINGFNPNEILLIDKSPKNTGFFEKFFNFFS